MQKTMKKLLSIILTILMIVTTVPVAFAAEGDAPLTIDVTDKNVVGIGKGAIFYDEDGYIITGTNENCDINVYESSNITLRNLSAKSMRINSPDGAFITIKLEGINELAENLSFYKDHIIFEGSDDAIFKADYIYNGGTSEASVTLNGGNIVFESVSRENYTVCCGKLIINGGTLTVSNDSYYVIGSPVELNGGEFNIISTSQQYPAILNKITMKKGALLTVSTKTGILGNLAEIAMSEDVGENDYFFVRYEKTGDFTLVKNIKSALAGKTYAEIKVDTHIHGYEDSEWIYSTEKHWKECSCGEISEEAAHTYIDGKCDVCGAEVKDITITMTDSYGDGWSYNAIQVGFISEGVFTKIADATIDDGANATYETVISDGEVVAFRWTKGSYPQECSFTISVDGETVFEKSDCSDLADNELIYIYCNHNFTDSVCSICGLTCGVDFSHKMNGDECSACGYVCNHVYTNHYCKICGNVEDGYYAGVCGAVKADDAIWSLDSEGTLTISGEGEYSVPYSNTPWDAYSENIKNVVIEEGITNIDDGSFYYLTNAVTLSIPSTVTTVSVISNFNFAEIKVAEGNNYYSVIDGVLFNYDKTDLIMYPAEKAGETYTVPDGVTTLAGYSFGYVKNLKTVNISDDVTTIEYSCFYFSSIENINFGENVEVVENSAFSSTGLKTVVLPEKLEEISDYLFYGCKSLETLVIGSNVKTIGSYTITYCTALEAVHFTGTEEQWQAITKPDDSEDAINTIEVHFGALEEKDGIDATCAEAGHTAGLYCDECNAYLTGEEIPATGNHTYVDGKCECGDECKHPGQTGAECEICGSALHVCDFSGEWNYSDEDHWKECSCGEISAEAEHTFTDGKCDCGYVCDHAGQTGICTICGMTLHVCDFSGEWQYDSEKHWKECTCGETSEEAEHTFTDGKCDCGYECAHANYVDGACDNCDVKQKYTVRMETKLSKGVEFVGNPVAIHGEDLIIEFKNLVSEKCNDVSLFELTIGANSFYEFEFDKNGITFDGTVLTIPGELVNGDVETRANAYTQARIKLNGGKFNPECPPDIVEEYFIENDYAISNKMLVGYNNSVKDKFVKDKHTIKSILASDGNDYNKIYYFSPNSDLEMTIEWECLPENFENGVCVECGYECSHEKYTDGVCDVCGYKCPHEWVGVAFAKPTRTEEGYYTYTCSVCKSTKTEPVERPANYAEFKELIEKVKGYLDENLTDSMMQEVKNVINFFELDENHGFIKGEENTVSQMIRQISGFVEVVEEGIADGTAVKVDGFTVYNERGREWLLKFADEGIFEKARELILNSTEVKAKLDEIYDFALSLEGNVAENAENIAKIEADVDEFFGQLKKCVYGIHNVSQYKEISPAKCGENAVESATCTLCGETVTREVENSALTHSFTKYEETEAPKCGVEGKEVAYCDHGCGETDEKAIEALKHSFTKYEVTEEAKCGVEGKEVAYCDNGCGETDEKAIEALKHSFTKYEVTEEAKCGVEGKEVATCDNGCGATDEKAIAALTHKDADGDYKCDNGCGHEFEKPAPEEPTPDTPDEPTDDVCDHLCHKSGILGFFWKIVKFFSKLFKINPVCECGVAHY